MIGIYKKIIVILLTVIMHSLMFAYSFSPSVATMSPRGNNSSFIYTVTNQEDRPIPLEITIYDLIQDINGVRSIGDEVNDDFLVFPAQFILKKKETRRVQVRWVGDPDIQIEKAFTVLCKELKMPAEQSKPDSVDIERTTFGLNILVNYATRLMVTPFYGNSEIVIESFDISTNEAGKNEIIIICSNIGNIHDRLLNHSFIIRPGSDKKQFPEFVPINLNEHDITGMAEVILAKSSRRFVIPWPEKLPFGKINVELVKNAK
ncbi:MAG: hypothetical protein KKD38_04725 [Candidatus Delongbacteria bacterium]|nr:hypothetical protein [Candidatus Delongbacteria bacterium]MCG2761294.1 hypothetical protein [Candidatus Delongbacteria bacterium]